MAAAMARKQQLDAQFAASLQPAGGQQAPDFNQRQIAEDARRAAAMWQAQQGQLAYERQRQLQADADAAHLARQQDAEDAQMAQHQGNWTNQAALHQYDRTMQARQAQMVQAAQTDRMKNKSLLDAKRQIINIGLRAGTHQWSPTQLRQLGLLQSKRDALSALKGMPDDVKQKELDAIDEAELAMTPNPVPANLIPPSPAERFHGSTFKTPDGRLFTFDKKSGRTFDLDPRNPPAAQNQAQQDATGDLLAQQGQAIDNAAAAKQFNQKSVHANMEQFFKALDAERKRTKTIPAKDMDHPAQTVPYWGKEGDPTAIDEDAARAAAEKNYQWAAKLADPMYQARRQVYNDSLKAQFCGVPDSELAKRYVAADANGDPIAPHISNELTRRKAPDGTVDPPEGWGENPADRPTVPLIPSLQMPVAPQQQQPDQQQPTSGGQSDGALTLNPGQSPQDMANGVSGLIGNSQPQVAAMYPDGIPPTDRRVVKSLTLYPGQSRDEMTSAIKGFLGGARPRQIMAGPPAGQTWNADQQPDMPYSTGTFEPDDTQDQSADLGPSPAPMQPPAMPTAQSQAPAAQSGVYYISSDDQYDKLPAGAVYVHAGDPMMRKRVKKAQQPPPASPIQPMAPAGINGNYLEGSMPIGPGTMQPGAPDNGFGPSGYGG
jgi:hypothetical protein